MVQSEKNQKPWSKWHERLHFHLQTDDNLLPQGASLLVAVSGGQDSMALIKLLIDLKRLYKWNLEVWHGNHGWHKNSSKIANEVKHWCNQNDLIFSCSTANPQDTQSESEARNWRYKKLIEKADKLSHEKPNKPFHHIITGHTGSDRAETLLLNLSRGSDLRGLSSMRRSRTLKSCESTGGIRLVRPLLLFSREETAKICSQLKQPIWIDPTNEDENFTRNKLRQKVMPVLENLHPGCSIRIANLSERLERYQDCQLALASLAIKSISTEEGLNRQELKKLPSSARAALLASWLFNAEVPGISTSKVEELSQRIGPNKPKGSFQLSKRLIVSWDRLFVKLLEV